MKKIDTHQQLTIALELVQACPEVRFILNHCGVPSIAERSSIDSESWQQWQTGIQSLARGQNFACKFSGITAYAKPEQRNVAALGPYQNEILETLGTQRIVWGGDWPVCNLGDGLKSRCELTDALLDGLSPNEMDSIICGNARLLYKL